MDVSGFAQRHIAFVLLSFGAVATVDPRLPPGSPSPFVHPNRATKIVPRFSGNCAR